MEKFYDIIIYFSVFSFAGWVCETIFVTVKNRKFAYRGFLNGPVCPVYGFGGLLVVYLLAPFQNNVIMLFIMGTLGTTVLEYMTSFIMEKVFNTRWWDYSHVPFNINGRVCLPFSLMFGGLSLFAVYVLYPPVYSFVSGIDPKTKPVAAIILLAIFLADVSITVWALLTLNGTLKELKAISEDLSKMLSELDKKNAGLRDKYAHLKNNFEREQTVIATAYENLAPEEKEVLNRFSDKEQRFKMVKGLRKSQTKRLMGAFPSMRSIKYREELSGLKDRLLKRVKGNEDSSK